MGRWLILGRVSPGSPSATSPDGGAPRAAATFPTSCRRLTSMSTPRPIAKRPCSVRSSETTTSASERDSSPEAARETQGAHLHARWLANGSLLELHPLALLDAALPSPPSAAESAT